MGDNLVRVIGQSGADKSFVSGRGLEGISSAAQVAPELRRVTGELSQRKKSFEASLPAEIASEKTQLGILEQQRQAVVTGFDGRQAAIRAELDAVGKRVFAGSLGGRLAAGAKVAFNWGKLAFVSRVQRPLAVSRENAKVQAQSSKIGELENNPGEVFKERNEEMFSRSDSLEEALKSKEYAGAKGELLVASQLAGLSDEFCLLNDVKIEFMNWLRYRGKACRSAQIDHVLIGPTGVFVIETKNWSNQYAQTVRFNPLEQAAIAGFLTHTRLENELGKDIRVNTILVPIKRNIHYDNEYPYVHVCYPEKLADYIKEQRNVLLETEVSRIIGVLQ